MHIQSNPKLQRLHCQQEKERDLREERHIPDIPTGETPDKLENERLSLSTEVKKQNNHAVIKGKMDKTFSLQRQEIVVKESEVKQS